MLKDNYSSWQERRITEEDKRKILDLEQEKLIRLETGRKKQENYKISQDIESKEEAMSKRLILAEIKENFGKGGKKANPAMKNILEGRKRKKRL